MRDVVGWKFPDNDLLYLLDAQGKALVEFSEVEDGIFEAPTPGLGVLFLQNAGDAAAAPPRSRPTVAGDWLVKRGDTHAACALTLHDAANGDSFPLTIKPGCDPAIGSSISDAGGSTRASWCLLPARGEPWRFEDIDGSWHRLSEGADQITLVRQ